LKLWQQAFSTHTVLEEKADLAAIADKFELAGGSIINAVQYASLMALSREENIIREKDILDGIRKEFRKEGKTI
jgi:ATP-dependent 26S proteasome regulatory subunit